MPRIIAGTHGGRSIASPPTDRTRPTSDRVREAIFSKLEVWDVVRGARVFDLYAGTGALGFEALSRGARHVVAVEGHRATATSIERNAVSLGMDASLDVDVTRLSEHSRLPSGSATLVFADPPYSVPTANLTALITRLAREGHLEDEATLVIERSSRSEPLELPEDFVHEQSKDFGDTRVEYFTYLDPEVTARSAVSDE